MSDELLLRLAALDAPRPLPPELFARVERVVMAEAEGLGDLAAADGARPMPGHARDRLEETLVRVAVIRPLPALLRDRLERKLVKTRRPWQPVATAAAILLLLAATVAFLAEDREPFQDSGGFASQASSNDLATGEEYDAVQGFDPSNDSLAAGPAGAVETAMATAGHGPTAYGPYPAPPYSVITLSIAHSSTGGPDQERRDPPPLEPLRVGVIAGDEAQEAGFRAYISLVNSRGGTGGHRLDVVPAGASNTVATVNLSRAPVADGNGVPNGTRAPLVESVDVLEPALRGSVFSLSSVPERQAHLAVAAALGAGGAGTRAVLYTAGSGPFASRVPDALEQALRARAVDVIRVRWNPAVPAPLVAAGIAFVSLPTEEAGAWLRAAKSSGYAPAAGIWGIWSLADESLLADMPANVRALSPYELVSGAELRDLTTRTGKLPSARLVHGWATAKWLAVSIWLSQADSNQELAAALAREGFESGFAPPIEYRPETYSRVPEAVVLKPHEGRLVAEGTFRRE